MADTSQVSWVQPDFSALTETDGHGDTCGPIVMLDYRHLAHGVPLDITTLDASRAELISWGLMNAPGLPGMTIDQIDTALSQHYSVQPIKKVSYGSLNEATYHNDLINALNAKQAVITLWLAAHSLPNNQPGVNNHYTLTWGIQSDIGYYTANGDTLLALAKGGVVGPVWYTWSDYAGAQPGAYLILPALPEAPAPTFPLTIAGVVQHVHHAEVTYG